MQTQNRSSRAPGVVREFTDKQAVSKIAHPSHRDVELFLELVEHGATLESEQVVDNGLLDQVIKKPWGHEYRIYVDSFYDVWKLWLAPGQTTSLHCHPRKETSLLCIRGRAKVRMLNHTRIIGAGEHVHFHRGTFHSTANIGDEPLELIEVEAPRNKLDLVRLADNYGRRGKGYEQETLPGDVPPLLAASMIPSARVRSSCITGAFGFSVRLGAELDTAPGGAVRFAVELGLRSAFHHLIHVTRGAELSGGEINPRATYLVVQDRTPTTTTEKRKS